MTTRVTTRMNEVAPFNAKSSPIEMSLPALTVGYVTTVELISWENWEKKKKDEKNKNIELACRTARV